MKVNLADSSKEPSLKNLHQLMLEVATDAKIEHQQIIVHIENSIKEQLAKLQNEFRSKK
jgi:hypothetical protein